MAFVHTHGAGVGLLAKLAVLVLFIWKTLQKHG